MNPPVAGVPFNPDAMVMYAWYADAHRQGFPVTWINRSLRQWLESQLLMECIPGRTDGPIPLQTFFETVLGDARLAALNVEKLASLIREKSTPSLDSGQEGLYRVVVRNVPPGEGEQHLASVRIVAPAGIPMVSDGRRRLAEHAITLVDIVSVVVFDENGDAIGVQGQLQEASSRVEAVQEQASRAAIASVMSRNMSHNLGSHVLARLSGMEAMRSALGRTGDSGDIRLGVSVAIEQLWPLCSFVRSRMDFVADIATASSVAPAVALPVLSHVLQPLAAQGLIARNLCASHTAGGPVHRLRLGVTWPNGAIDYVNVSGRERPQSNPQLTTVSLGVPNGVVGCQALYAILENLIRNSAKYSPAPLPASFVVTVHLNLKEVKTVGKTMLLPIVVYDDLGSCEHDSDTLRRITAAVERPLLTQGMLVDTSARGLKEMKAAAAYLRRIHPSEISGQHDPPLLTPVQVDNHLGYEFWVLLPANVLITGRSVPEDKEIGLRTSGIVVARTVEDARKRGVDPEVAITYGDHRPVALEAAPLRQLYIHQHRVVVQYGTFTRSMPIEAYGPIVEELERHLDAGDGFQALAAARELWARALVEDRLPTLSIVGDDNAGGELLPIEGSFVLYAWHGDLRHKLDNCAFYEPYGSTDPMGVILGRGDAVLERRLRWEVIEAALLPVLVIDERLQEIALRTEVTMPDKAPDQSLMARLAHSGVIVPDSRHSVPEAGPHHTIPGPALFGPASATLESLTEWVQRAAGESRMKFGIPPLLVVHLGVLESAGITSRAAAEQWVRGIEGHVAEVFITSGRGVPERCPGNARFISLSTLLVHTIERRSKYHFLQSLAASARPV